MATPISVVQLAFPNFGSDEELLAQQRRINDQLRRNAARRHGVAQIVIQIEAAWLKAPLLPAKADLPDVSLLAENFAEEAKVIASADDLDVCTEAFMHNFDLFAGQLLDLNLAVLASRGNVKEKLDILDWMFTPDYMGRLDLTALAAAGRSKEVLDVLRWAFPRGYKASRQSDHLVVPVYAVDVPFSFAWCCRIVSTDAERWRDAVEEELRALARKGKAVFVTAAESIGALH